MALVTRCPHCSTTFRVTPLHLQAHGGEVRCGHCSQVFNGFSTLTTVQVPETGDLFATSGVGSQASTTEATGNVNVTAAVPAPTAAAPPAQALFGETALLPTLNEIQNAQADTAADTYANANANANADADVATAEAGIAEAEEYTSRKSSWAWGMASLLLLVVLVGQGSYFYRTELSVLAPTLQPYLEQYCEFLECTVPLPQRAELLSIETSDLQSDPTQPAGVITLTATVRNRAPFPQAFPAFELTLTDTQDQPLASRILTPAQYLGAEKKSTANVVAQAIAPNQDINLKLYLDSGDLKAAGYRLFLFYP